MKKMSLYQTALKNRAIVRVSGSQAEAFLQNLLTQNVNASDTQNCQMAALLTPQGKLAYDFLIFTEDDCFLLDCAAAIAEDLVKRLNLYKLRADVDIRLSDMCSFAIWQEDGYPCPSALGFVTDPRHEGLGLRGVFEATPNLSLPEGKFEDWRHNRIRLGVAEGADEMPPASVFPLEFGLAEMAGVDFKKGCFIGQEVSSRTHRKGQLRKKLWPILFADEAPERGAAITDGQRQCGEIVSCSRTHALALIREDAALENLRCEGKLFTRLAGVFGEGDAT